MSDTNIHGEDGERARSLIASELKHNRESDDESSRTIAEFCHAKHISLSSYFKLRRIGRGPDEDRVPGTRIIRISRKAEREWDTRMKALAREEAAKLETERRRAQAAAAGIAAAASRPPSKPPREKMPTPSRVARPRIRR
jgi:hypothetical protein